METAVERANRVMAGSPHHVDASAGAPMLGSMSDTPLKAKPATKLLRGSLPGPRSPRVLVVDNAPDVAETLAMILRHLGYEVRVAFDGAHALATGAVFLPAAILVDIGMPGMDGYEVCRRLRQQPWGQAILAVAMTSYAGAHELQQIFDVGFDHFLAKPFDFDEIRRLMAFAS